MATGSTRPDDTGRRLAESFRDRKVLITGGLGFLGSNMAIRLAAYGAKLTLVDSLIPEYGGNPFNVAPIEDRVRVNIADVRDPHGFKYLVQGQDYLFNLAGQTSHMDSMKDPHTDLEINARAQLSILEACRHLNPGIKVVFASTRQIYGVPEYLPVDEAHPLHPTDVNGINKLSGEWYHRLYHKVYGIRSAVLRMTNTYGPRMRVRDARQTFLGIWIKQILTGETIKVWGDGLQLRDFNYADDAVNAFLLAATTEAAYGEVFNLGAEPAINLKDLAALLLEVHEERGAIGADGTKKPGRFEIIPFPPERKKIDIGDYYSDFKKFSALTGWQPQVSIEEGLRRCLDFYAEHGAEHYWNEPAGPRAPAPG